MNQNFSLSFCFSWSLTKPNLSNWICVPIFSFDSSGSPRPFVVELSGIVISILMLSASAGSHWMYLPDRFAPRLPSAPRPPSASRLSSAPDRFVDGIGFFERNENVLGFRIPMFSDLKLRRCMRR